jgi:hypothetical protein
MNVKLNWSREQDLVLRNRIERHLSQNEDDYKKFLDLTGDRDPAAYFEEYADHDDIGIGIVNDLKLFPLLKEPGRTAPVKKTYDPFEL